MDSDEDLELISPSDETSSPVQQRNFKRLKKLKTVSKNPSRFETLDFDISDAQAVEEPKSGSGSGSGSESNSGFKGFDEGNELSSGFDEVAVEGNGSGSVVKRTLDFDSWTEEVDGNEEDQNHETGIRDLEVEETEKKRRSFDEMESNEKKKRVKGVDDGEMSMLPERRTAKERREHLAQLRAESQRLLRETRDAAFKPAPIVQKPISSVLEKIRRRRLEVAKKTYIATDDHDDNSSKDTVDTGFENVPDDERGNDRVVTEVENEETIVKDGISDTLCSDEIKNAEYVSSRENLSPQIVACEEPKPAFRAPINDTEDLFSDSQTSDSKDELEDETPNSPKEVLAPSILAMNLMLDSPPLDDTSSDGEDNDEENIDPQPHESDDLSPTTNGDPVKAFLDEEAEEEDDSDNDLHRFQDDENEDDEDADDAEELRDMIATGYEEKQSDIDRRMELHQQLLDQQDAAKTVQLLRKWGPKQRETALLDDEGFEEDEDENEEDKEDLSENEDEDEDEDLHPVNLRMHIKKIKEMIPQMFTDKVDMYISSDDEEAEKRHVGKCLSMKANHQAELSPLTKDARSKELFGYIKRVNNIPETRRKAKTTSFSNMLFMGKKGNDSSKSSFIGRGSNCSIPSSTKQGSGIIRSFVFEREDNSSKSSKSTITMAESSDDVIQRENRPKKNAGSAKFSNSQTKLSAQPRKDEMETSSGAQLLEILRRSSSMQTSECSGKRCIVGHTESIFAAFKLEKKSIGTKKPNVFKTL